MVHLRGEKGKHGSYEASPYCMRGDYRSRHLEIRVENVVEYSLLLNTLVNQPRREQKVPAHK